MQAFKYSGSKHFEVLLGKAYYNNGFFNVPQKYGGLFAADKEKIEIQLGDDPQKLINGTIDRSSNNSGAPRIRCGVIYTRWVQRQFEIGDCMYVRVLSPGKIQLSVHTELR